MGAAAAIVMMRERQVVEAFERAGSLSAPQSVVPYDIGVEESGVGWRRLRSRAVVRESEPGSGRYYVDIEVWEALRRTRRRVLLMFLVAAVAAFAAASAGIWSRSAT